MNRSEFESDANRTGDAVMALGQMVAESDSRECSSEPSICDVDIIDWDQLHTRRCA
jgi:hypothetical protein